MQRSIESFEKVSFASEIHANWSVFRIRAALAAVAFAVSPLCFALGDEPRAVDKPANSTTAPAATSRQGDGEIPPAGNSRMPAPAALGVLVDQSKDAVTVSEVITGSPAERAGIIVGDEIRFVGDFRIFTPQELTEVLGASKPGTPVELMIRRNGRRQIVEATVAAWDTIFGERERVRTSEPGRESAGRARESAGPKNGTRTYKSYSYGPNNGPSRPLLQVERQRLRALEQQVSRLQREINALRSSQHYGPPNADQDWQNRVRRGETDNDPALFQ